MDTNKHEKELRKVRNVKQKDGVTMPVPVSKADLPDGYANLLVSLKQCIQQVRIKTVLSANCAMVMLYRDIRTRKTTKRGLGGKSHRQAFI